MIAKEPVLSDEPEIPLQLRELMTATRLAEDQSGPSSRLSRRGFGRPWFWKRRLGLQIRASALPSSPTATATSRETPR